MASWRCKTSQESRQIQSWEKMSSYTWDETKLQLKFTWDYVPLIWDEGILHLNFTWDNVLPHEMKPNWLQLNFTWDYVPPTCDEDTLHLNFTWDNVISHEMKPSCSRLCSPHCSFSGETGRRGKSTCNNFALTPAWLLLAVPAQTRPHVKNYLRETSFGR